ncbi:MAG: glycosyltransferase [Nitriliruptoraceae bacterium]
MRIVQIANLVHPTSGGIGVVLDRLGAGYLAAGHRRAVVTAGPGDRCWTGDDGTLRASLRGVALPGGAGYRVVVDRGRLRRLLTTLAPDAIELSDRLTLPWVADWAHRRKIPVTIVVHERAEHALSTWLPAGLGAEAVAARADGRLARRPARLVAPSAFAAAAFPPDTVSVVPWGVDLTAFHPARRRSEARDGLAHLVLVGRLSREKRPELAIEALRRLLAEGVRAELTILGDGPLRARLHRQSIDLPVRFLGHRPTLEVATILADADVCLAPCPGEAFGLAALEALACGTPIAAAKTGALPELLGLPAGRSELTPAGATASPTAQAFAFAVERLLGLPEQQRRRSARAVAARRSWSSSIEAMLEHHARTVHLAAVA